MLKILSLLFILFYYPLNAKLIETKRVYTEKEYWEGKVPDDQFESYLNKYGYEYTPIPEKKVSQRARHSDLDAL